MVSSQINDSQCWCCTVILYISLPSFDKNGVEWPTRLLRACFNLNQTFAFMSISSTENLSHNHMASLEISHVKKILPK